MSKKEKFIEEIENLLIDANKNLSEDAAIYFEALKLDGDESNKVKFTENGKLILGYIQDNYETFNNMFKAADIANGMNLTSRTVSGASRKLVTDGYLEKIGKNPVTYSLTDLGKTVDLSEE